MLFQFFSRIICEALPMTCVENGTIALTIDEGPSMYTEQILDILEKENVKACFHFNPTIRGSEFDDIYQRAIDDGHDVGFRTSPNRVYTDEDDYDEIEEDLNHQLDHFESKLDQKVKFARSPLNGSLPVANVYNYFKSKKIIQTSYSFCPYDEDGADPEERLKDFLAPTFNKRDSFIIQLYEQRLGEDDNLKEMINIIKEKNYSLVPMSECLDGYIPGKAIQNKGRSKKSKATRINFTSSILPILFYLVI